MFEELGYIIEEAPSFCFFLLIIWGTMLVLIYRDAKGLDVDERKVIGLIFFSPFLLGFLFSLVFEFFDYYSLFMVNYHFFMGIPILIWLLYRNLLTSGRGFGSNQPSSPPPPPDKSEDKNTGSTYWAPTGATDTKAENEEPVSGESRSLKRCPECGEEVEDDWNLCINCGASLEEK